MSKEDIKVDEYLVFRFNKGSHGFKMSPIFPKMYYYNGDGYNMDYKDLPLGKWEIASQQEDCGMVAVTLKPIDYVD